jgi:hypothetical protein
MCQSERLGPNEKLGKVQVHSDRQNHDGVCELEPINAIPTLFSKTLGKPIAET